MSDTAIRPFRVEIPQAALDDLADRLAPRHLARRAARRRRRVRVTSDRVRALADVLAGAVRLARRRGPPERPPAVRHRDRRRAHPLPARPVVPAGRHAAGAHPRLARLGAGVPRRDRPAHRAGRPGRAGLPPGHPVAARLRLLRPDPQRRLEPVPHRPRLGRADEPPGLRPLRRGRQRRRLDDLARAGPDRPRSTCSAYTSPSSSRSPPATRPSSPGSPRPTRRRSAHLQWFYENKFAFNQAAQPAAADPGVRAGGLAGRAARLERPALRRGPGRRLHPRQRGDLLVHRHGRPRRSGSTTRTRTPASTPTGPTTVPTGAGHVRRRLPVHPPLRRTRPREHRQLELRTSRHVEGRGRDVGGHYAAHQATDVLVADIREFFASLR